MKDYDYGYEYGRQVAREQKKEQARHNELSSHKKSDTVKWVLTLIAFILTGIMFAGIICGWFVKKEATLPTETEQTEAMQDSDAVAVSFTRMASPYSAVPYADSASNGVRKPSDEVLRAEVEKIINSIVYWSAYEIDINKFTGTVVSNNINATRLSLEDAECRLVQYAAPGGAPTTQYLILAPKYNPFGDLGDYGVCNVTAQTASGTEIEDKVGFSDGVSDYYCAFFAMQSQIPEIIISYELIFDREAIPLPEDPVKEGYDFVGWFYGTQAEHGNGTSCKAYDGEPIYSDTSLHAHFAIKKFTVRYNSTGGTTIQNQTVDWNTVAPTPSCTRTGYNFLGWYLSDGTKYEGQAIKEDTVLTARWEIKRFTVTFYVDGEEYKSMEVEYGTTFTDVAEAANSLGLHVKSFASATGEALGEYVTDDLNVNAAQMNSTDKAINAAKNNTWAIVGGIVGGVALLAVIGAIVSAIKRRRAG